jgi:hypothetical protein
MRGLDPRIHPSSQGHLAKVMDCRVNPGNDSREPHSFFFSFERIPRPVRPRAGRAGFLFDRGAAPGLPGAQTRKFKMHISKNLLLGLAAATLIMESVVIQPALAADKVSLFKIITAKDEIVIGISDDELAQVDGKNAGGIAKALVAKGSMSVWQYAVHKSATGDLEQAPLHKIGLLAAESLRVEPYATPLKVLPIDESKK